METQKQKDLLIAWLKDAYAMEQSLVQTMTVYANEAKDYPMVQEKITAHIEDTKQQAEKIKARLEAMSENTSALKNIAGAMVGRMQGHSTMGKDKPIKNALDAFAAEYYEIACYSAISTLAEKLGDSETAAMAEAMIEEEQEMADWAEENLPTLIDEFIAKEE